ncbi:hypothetical protein CC86DRAFT_47574 [Ophiobolus disseminans]|uniref:Uncharacterized protein n=1 Tax=Ophiobolus disseminans TaxID=1469910 RepID=A0A6A6ZWX6_9PLEO|nr:hypothetical protein CC86DRAFT_47574 [Ophiobolus disseminans]
MNASHANGTQFHTWRPEPQVRGTFSILSSCLLTMVLCVWTAVHLNIPEYGKLTAQVWRKLGWVMISLLAPELVLLTAYYQYTDAMELGRLMRENLKNKPRPSILQRSYRTLAKCARVICCRPLRPVPNNEGPIKTIYPWTDAHSLYAAMGGFVIDTKGRQSYLPKGMTRATIGMAGIKFIAQYAPELLATIPESEIQDKSKANVFIKDVACSQAL